MMQECQVLRMIGFLQQEAKNRAAQIDLRTNEACCLLKAEQVRLGKQAIDKEYRKKTERLALSTQMEGSRGRQELLRQIAMYKDSCCRDVHNQIIAHMNHIARHPTKYLAILKLLLAQAVFSLRESKVNVTVRKRDITLTELILREISQDYQKTFGTAVEITVQKGDYLDDGEIGGVQVESADGRKICSNTIRRRIDRVMERAAPVVRLLFSEDNKNRTDTEEDNEPIIARC